LWMGSYVNEKPIPRSQLLAQLMPEWPTDPLPAIQEEIERSQRKLVVIDDDPTGSQVVENIPLLTTWTEEALTAELKKVFPAFFILTNSRSLLPEAAQEINAEVGRGLAAAVAHTGCPVAVVSRSDSTLRGHFPGEVQALADGLGQDFHAWLLIPALPSAGRYTIDDVHYAAEDEMLIPAGQSAYAQDATFGYRSSNLKEWVEEKTGGKVPASQVASVSLEDIRQGGPEGVTARLMQLPPGSVCVINSVTRRDLDVFVLGLLRAEAQGRRFLYRTGPTFVPARIGIGSYELLEPAELRLPDQGGGLIVVGSYVPKTSGQVTHLLEHGDVTAIEIQVDQLLNEAARPAEVARAAELADETLRQNKDCVLYTSRKLVTGGDSQSSRAIGQSISEGVIKILHAIQTRPRYILAKGGITSNDVATHGLGVQRAMVRGQIITGVSVWQLGSESRYPDIAYLVFPGNVGGTEALTEVVRRLKRPEGEAL
jgi:uncharacterized protein YgbK (DUF1537 family)